MYTDAGLAETGVARMARVPYGALKQFVMFSKPGLVLFGENDVPESFKYFSTAIRLRVERVEKRASQLRIHSATGKCVVYRSELSPRAKGENVDDDAVTIAPRVGTVNLVEHEGVLDFTPIQW